MKRACPAVLAAFLCAVVALPGCKPSPAVAPQPTASPVPEGAPKGPPEGKSGIVLGDLRIVLPRVADRPAALYFSLNNAGTARATLIGVYVDGATKAEMHETAGDTMKPITKLVIEPHTAVTFAPGGKHVMLYRIPGTWKSIDRPAVTLKFADGDKISGKAAIEKAQSADAMPAMASDAPRAKM